VGHAALMRYEYGGTITSADPSTGITPGSRFSGTFTYDPAGSPPALSNLDNSTQYFFGLSPYLPGSQADGSGITLQIGGKPVLPDPGGVYVNVTQQDAYRNADGTWSAPSTTVTIGNNNTNGSPLLGLELANPTRWVFQSLAPPSSLNFADFPVAQISAFSSAPGTAGQTLFAGTIDTLQEVPVPEPAWAMLLCLTAAGWLARSARRIRNPWW
jgi:hypothetical protein